MVTIHNLAYQGWLGGPGRRDALPDELAQVLPPGSDGILLLREGIERAELVNTVSPGYAQEILRPAAGMGLDKALTALGHRFGGILNGLDMASGIPATDAALPASGTRAATWPARRPAAGRCWRRSASIPTTRARCSG
jgi:starch synthase